MPYDAAYDRASVVFYLLAMAALLATQYAYLRVWFTAEQALVGVLLVACTLRITIRQHDYAPSSYLEPSFFALGLLAILHGRRGWFAVLVAIATLNRETAIFLIALFAVTQPLTRDTIKTVAAYFAIWLVIFAGLRYLGGEAERYWTLERVFRTNVSQLWLAAFNITALLGAFWIFALLGRAAGAGVRPPQCAGHPRVSRGGGDLGNLVGSPAADAAVSAGAAAGVVVPVRAPPDARLMAPVTA